MVQVLAYRLGDKPSLELVMTEFTDAYVCHQGQALLQPYDAIGILSADGSTAFNESCAPIG